MKFISFIKSLVRIVNSYDSDLKNIRSNIASAEKIIKDRTEISADVGFSPRCANQIIVVGRYRNADFIQVYSIMDQSMDQLIDQLRSMQHYGSVRKIDAPYGFKATVQRHL